MDGTLLKVGYAEEKSERVYVRNDIMTFEIDEINDKYSKSKVTYRRCRLARSYRRVRCKWI